MLTRNLRQVLFRSLVLCSLLLLALSAARPAAAEPPSPAAWRDEFSGPTLDPAWGWLNENPARWSLGGGFLTILTSEFGTGGENLLLRGVAPGDFSIETHLFFAPDTNFQIAGLVIWQDAENFLQLGRAYCDIEGPCAGNAIYFDKALGGAGQDGNFATNMGEDEAYLRLERRGEMVRGFFSYEGITWFEIGTHWIPPEFVVNGVGLTAAQDFFTPGVDLPAAFDYFEMSEGGGFLPDGYHDYDNGDVPNWACNAGGWAVDPDDRDTDVLVEINVDGSVLETFPAGEYREDLEASGECVGGSCGFFLPMWDLITAYETHNVQVFAQDLGSGEWVGLHNSPRDLTCRTYDLYAFNPLSGETETISELRDADEYQPAWSPNGKKVVFAAVYLDGGYDTLVKNLVTGTTTPLAGADAANGMAWSPDGKWIAYDRFYAGDESLYRIPFNGGAPQWLRGDALSPSWSPNSQRLAFRQPSDGSIRTLHINSGVETFVTYGEWPAWAPNGKWLAFARDGDIWKIGLNPAGMPQGEAVRLTQMNLSWGGNPAWSPDGNTIYFHAGAGRDGNLWSVPAAGGLPVFLTGGIEFGDYDPDASKMNGKVAYASFTPNGQAPRSWLTANTYDMPPGYWSEGGHNYHFEFNGGASDPMGFDASYGEPLYDDFVLLRGHVLRGRSGDACSDIGAIHPDQQTRFHIAWLEENKTFEEAAAIFAAQEPMVTWDGGPLFAMQPAKIVPLASELDVYAYLCGDTYPAQTHSIAIGNLRLDFNPFNNEMVDGLFWRNSPNLTNSDGGLEFFGDAWVSENEGTPDFFFASLVGWGTAGTWLQQGTSLDIASQSIGWPGGAAIPVQTHYQFFQSPLKADSFAVVRSFDFGGGGYEHNIRPYIPRLFPQDGFNLVVHPNAAGDALLLENPADCEFGCLVTDWNGTWFAIHNPLSGEGLLVVHAPSPHSAALWVDQDGASFTNATSVVLLPPPGGFSGVVSETEYFFFYQDSWSPFAAGAPLPTFDLPIGLTGVNLSLEDPVFQVALPLSLR